MKIGFQNINNSTLSYKKPIEAPHSDNKSIAYSTKNAAFDYRNHALSLISFRGITLDRKEIEKREKFSGCLLGGAIGDALGTPVEFYNISEIQKYYGKDGVQDLEIAISGESNFSDDTQMLIFTADGILKSIGDEFNPEKPPQIEDLYESYLNWYKTQTTKYPDKNTKGWIANQLSLYSRVEPGDTCLCALGSGKMGTVDNPINNSKGSGGVMRVAPIGLVYRNNPELAFKIGMDSAAITHGHPSGYLSAGFMASCIAYLVKGENLEEAVEKSLEILDKYDNNDEVKNKVVLAMQLAKEDISTDSAIKTIGQGWIAEEALGIALYCALTSKNDFRKAVLTSVNHSGDSDTTGAITGNIMGTLLGISSIPKSWINKVQDKKLLTTLSMDLLEAPRHPAKYKEKYPYNGGRTPNWYVKSTKIPAQSIEVKYTVFSQEELERMSNMTVDEVIEFKKRRLESKKNIS